MVTSRTAVVRVSGELVHYTVRDGYAYWGDIGVGRVEDIERDGLTIPAPLGARPIRSQGSHGKDLLLAARRWSLPIPYVVTNAVNESAVSDAIKMIESRTTVRFARRTIEADYVVIRVDPTLSGVCNSDYLGQKGGVQYVSTPPAGCASGTLVHELLHVLGFGHEQQRADRDQFIRVNAGCILPDYQSQYAIRYAIEAPLSYDLASIMHYGSRDFSTGSCDTFSMTPPWPAFVAVPFCPPYAVGQSCGLSFGDVAAINYFYSTPISSSPAPSVASIVSTIQGAMSKYRSMPINQHGLTGNWYQPSTGGAGIPARSL